MEVTKLYPDSNGLFNFDERSELYLMIYFPEENCYELNPFLDSDLRSEIELLLLGSDDWLSDLQRLGVDFSDAYEFYSSDDEDFPFQVLYLDCGLDCLFD